VVLSFRL